MKKLALLLPYFGKLPNYFPLWLYSAGANEWVDYLLFTDCELAEYAIPPNVHCIPMTFEEIKKRVSKILEFKFVLHNPYKLCDYKPLYGLIFQDYLREYDFWGHCDPDIIWGNLSHFLTLDLFEQYDRLYCRGHLCVYRNIPSINEAALQTSSHSCISYKDVYTHRYSAHFDEGKLIKQLVEAAGGKIWDRTDFADVSYFHKQFVLVKHEAEQETIAAFRWNNGALLGLGINGELSAKQEYAYVHLQKRKMAYCSRLEKDDFLIVPNEFLPGTVDWTKSAEQLLAPDDSFERAAWRLNRRNQVKNICEGALLFRIKRICDLYFIFKR